MNISTLTYFGVNSVIFYTYIYFVLLGCNVLYEFRWAYNLSYGGIKKV